MDEEQYKRIVERETQAAKSGKTAHDCDKPTGVCRDCKWWACTVPRVVGIKYHASYVTKKASGHCNNPEIPMCLCMKDEDRACNHCEGPAAVNPVPEHIIPEGQPILMPWNSGYEKWAKEHPELIKENDGR